MKIRAHLALIAAFTLVPVILFSTIALNLLQDAERKAALTGLHEKTHSTALMIDQEIGSAEAALRVLANSQRLAMGDLAGFHEQARLVRSGSSSWVMLLDKDGRQVLNTVVPYGSVLPAPSAETRAQAETVMSTRTTLVSALTMSSETRRPIVTVNVPVEIEGAQRYVLAQAFATEHFTPLFTRNAIPADWTAAIIDQSGNFITRNRQTTSMMGRPARPELVQAARQADSGQIRHATLEGVDSFDVFTHTPLSGWTVAIAVPAKTIEAAAQRAVMVAALGLLAALLAAGITAALVSRRLLLSIRSVDSAAASLMRGEAPEPTKTGVEEIDKVANALASAGTVVLQEKQQRIAVEAERARLLENERLARQQAELQNRQKDQFLAMLGHELRNPLSAISGAIAVMKARDASAALNVRAHTIIERQSNHLSNIVDDLLDLSRMSMGKITLSPELLDLSAVVHASVETLYAAGRVGECDIGIESEPAWIEADRTRLDQIIGNVIGNALKFSSLRGRVDIIVVCEGREAVWTVRDFGIGIAEELMPNIFDAFVQGAAQTDHAFGGLGIGLNLVRQLVELHHGVISVTSLGTGTGTTVEIRFPLVETSRAEAMHAVPRAAMSAQEQPALTMPGVPSGEGSAISTVLLIEDNADSREMMSMLLGMLGYRVFEAANGNDGLSLARQEKPAIAVVDIGLPDMDGYQVARALRADPALQGMTVIALTGYGQDADRQRALAAGFDSHLVKPLDMDVLVNTIVTHQAKLKAISPGPGSDS